MSNRDLLLTEIYFLINLDKDFSADFAIVRKFKLIMEKNLEPRAHALADYAYSLNVISVKTAISLLLTGNTTVAPPDIVTKIAREIFMQLTDDEKGYILSFRANI
ncbi:hypothetical protein DOK_17390 [gamma proteobacterium BDW918]|jgi:hypothetical protein|uniref:Uncharacterized protein n=1 Tax=Zhongshania aliphaticivorans TaxID=1470434 RepID=A0A127MA07_9GAMM|nr:hypothetical protein [Zhongshania aliphaticivorans]AMO70059.1 hypothetical protein AZF00_17900 [Zhongshania aliphaticivorans]EIF41742.1 hypothetical protein DOK_17390 [gamma proteobacterium BDW918]|tara:strand:+ start:8058 stop:8372 length:315 start_codon:yes stop_codon:yes gene_type:complete